MPAPCPGQSATAGDYSRIIQVHGDNAVIGLSPSLELNRPRRQRPPQPSASANEAALLVYREEATEFIGRRQLLEEFITWATTHDPARPVSVRVLTGNAGAGKTRFAMELCRALGQIQSVAWQAGFVRDHEARRFLSLTNLSGWGWQNPTLAVFDYALTLVDVLPAWMAELGEVSDSPHPLRILLLERNADKDAGWLKQVFPGGYSPTEQMLDGLPMRLPGLYDPEIQRGIMQAMLDRLGSTVVLPGDTPAFRDQLARTDWAGAPLFLMMAAMVMHRQGGVDHALSLRRADLAKLVAQHEHSRLTQASNSNQSMQRFLSHMAALSTICGGLDGEALLDRIRQEKEFLGHEELGNDAVANTLKQLLPDGKAGVAPILPDIVGEAFLFDHLGHGEAQASTEAVLRAFSMAPAMVATMLIRCILDFSSAFLTLEDMALTAKQKRAIGWLEALAGQKDLPLHLLMLLSDALPKHTLILRELAAALTERLAAGLRELPEQNVDHQLALSISLNNLALRRSALGQREKALAAAQEAIKLSRALFQTHPEASRPNLALILTNLSHLYFDVGKINESVAAAFEATELCRELVKTHHKTFYSNLAASHNNLAYILRDLGQYDAAFVAAYNAATIFCTLSQSNPKSFMPSFSTSLNTFSNILSDLGKRKEALAAAQEAMTINRVLAKACPDAYRSSLITSLNTLANRFHDHGQMEEAFAATKEATELCRDLAQTRPDVFRSSLALSLNNLANRLADLGKCEDALAAAREAVSIRRLLAQAHPEAFRSDLANSLNNLANRLADLGKREDALAAAREAVSIRRALAQGHPEAFCPDLANSLNNLANRFTDLGQSEEALAAAQEAVTIHRELAQTRPEAFRPDLAMSLNTLATRLADFGKYEKALATAKEAVELYRELSQAYPEAFRPYLAGSLNNLANILSELGQRKEALDAAHEAAAIFFVLTQQHPQAFGKKFMIAMLTWLSLRHGISREDAASLFQKDPEAHVRALFEGLDDTLNQTTS